MRVCFVHAMLVLLGGGLSTGIVDDAVLDGAYHMH